MQETHPVLYPWSLCLEQQIANTYPSVTLYLQNGNSSFLFPAHLLCCSHADFLILSQTFQRHQHSRPFAPGSSFYLDSLLQDIIRPTILLFLKCLFSLLSWWPDFSLFLTLSIGYLTVDQTKFLMFDLKYSKHLCYFLPEILSLEICSCEE